MLATVAQVREQEALLLAVLLQDLTITQATQLTSHSQCLTAAEASQLQAIMQQTQIVAAGVGVPASLIQQLDAVAIIQQQAADADMLAGGARTQQKAAVARGAQIVAGALQQVARARHQQQAAAVAAVQQERLVNELAQAQHGRAQTEALLAATQRHSRRLVEGARQQRDTANVRVRTLEAELAQAQAVEQRLADKVAQAQAVPVVDPLVRGARHGRVDGPVRPHSAGASCLW